jgi:hypothetical protein
MDFVPCRNCLAIAKDEFTAVYVPMIPGKLPAFTEPLPAGPDRVEAPVRSSMIQRVPEDLKLLRRPQGMTGMIVNGCDPPSSEDRNALEERYPGIDLSRCIIFQEDRKPTSEIDIQIFVGIGVILGLGGSVLLGLAAWGWKRRRSPPPIEHPPLPGGD